nr:hypothetical protein [Tanacetum cinerariifolium]
MRHSIEVRPYEQKMIQNPVKPDDPMAKIIELLTASPNYSPTSPNYSPVSDTESGPSKDPSSYHIPPVPAILPFLSSTNNTTDSDTPDTPPSPTHARDSSLDSSSEASLDFHSDASPVSSSRHSLPYHSSPDLPSTSAGPSHKRRRYPMASVPALSPVSRALSYVYADLIPLPKRIRDSDYLVDVKVNSRESFELSRSIGTDIWVDDDIERVDKSHSEHEINPVKATIEACFDFTDTIRSRGIDMRARLMNLMTDVYCPRNEIQKMEIKLWNMTVKNLTAYTQRFHELILLCNRMVLDEEDRVERFIRGSPNNNQGNVIAVNLARLQEAIRIANQLIDKKLQGYAARSAENKRRMESNPRDNRVQQPPFKRQNVGGQNVARAYKAGNNERRGYALLENQQGVIYYECGRPGHMKRDCPKLRNQNHGSKVGNKTGNKTCNNETTTKAHVIGGGGANSDSNIVMGTFLLNNCYVSMLFDSGVDRIFVSSTFSALLDVAPSTLDTSYAVERADGRISETNIIHRGYTLGLLGHPFDMDLMPIELGSFDVIIGMD